jgi:type II secretory pathway pseudopilin PulG
MIAVGKYISRYKRSSGYTIVEIMIVLSITGFLFVSFAIAVQGKQANAKFKQASNDIKIQLQQIINETQSGHYPATSLKYEADASGCKVRSGANEQGSNGGCLFIGKLVQFDRSSDPNSYRVYTVSGVADQATITSSKPRVTDDATTYETRSLQHGLEIVWVDSIGGSGAGAVAFVQGFQEAGSSLYGTTTTRVVKVASPLNTTNTSTISNRLASSAAIPANVNPSAGYRICFRSGTTQQSALVTIGGSAGNNTVSLSIRGNTTCA